MPVYLSLIRPLLFSLDAERAYKLAIARPDIFHSESTLSGLGRQLGMDVDTLHASVKATMHERGSKALAEGPFYALGPIKSWLLVTLSGWQ